MSGEDVAKAFVTHFYSKFASNGALVSGDHARAWVDFSVLAAQAFYGFTT